MIKFRIQTLTAVGLLFLSLPILVSAHRSGCHRWHSCPSDTGSYVCGDLGYPCKYPTYPKSGGVIVPNTQTPPSVRNDQGVKQQKVLSLKKQISELTLKLQQLQNQLKELEK